MARAQSFDIIDARQSVAMLVGDFAGIRAVVAAKGACEDAGEFGKGHGAGSGNSQPCSRKAPEHNTTPGDLTDATGFQNAANDLATAADKLASSPRPAMPMAWPQVKAMGEPAVRHGYRAK